MATDAAAFNYNSPIDFRLPLYPPDGLTPGELNLFYTFLQTQVQIVQALVSYCGIGPQNSDQWAQLAQEAQASTLLPGNLNRLYIQAFEDILEGSAINLFGVGGVLQARNASAADNTAPCDGFCTTSGGILAGEYGEIQLGHLVANISGLTVGQRYWLAPSPGQVQPGPATSAGQIEQYVGIAITTNQLFVNMNFWIQH